MFPLDIWKIIFDYLDFRSKLSMVSICFFLRNNLFITDLYHINVRYLNALTTEILKYPIFEHVTKLNAANNIKITNVSFLKSLKILNAIGDCGISQDSINGLNLIELNASYNIIIQNVSFMKSLKILDARSSRINQDGITGLDLIELDASNNLGRDYI